MKKVILHGALGESFGREWTLDIATPAEALRAIEANKSGLFAHVLESAQNGVAYRVIVGERAITQDDLCSPTARHEVIQFVPVVGGAKNGGLGLILGGALLAFATFGGSLAATSLFSLAGQSFTLGSIAFSLGTKLILGGVSQLLAGTPEAPSAGFSPGLEKPSYFFNGPVTNAAQGAPVPVGYGQLIIGSTPISNGLTAENVV